MPSLLAAPVFNWQVQEVEDHSPALTEPSQATEFLVNFAGNSPKEGCVSARILERRKPDYPDLYIKELRVKPVIDLSDEKSIKTIPKGALKSLALYFIEHNSGPGTKIAAGKFTVIEERGRLLTAHMTSIRPLCGGLH